MTPSGPQNPTSSTLLPGVTGWDPTTTLKVASATNPAPLSTLGDLPVAATIKGPATFSTTVLILPFNRAALAGIDAATIRVFRYDEQAKVLRPVWNSGVNAGLGYAWAKVERPGTFVPIGLPLDPFVLQCIKTLAQIRAYSDVDPYLDQGRLTKDVIAQVLAIPEDELADLRRLLAVTTVQSGRNPIAFNQMERGGGFHLTGLLLPGAVTIADFKANLAKLDVPANGLPEESLLLPPDRQIGGSPLITATDPATLNIVGKVAEKLILRFPFPIHFPFCFFFSQDWPMYQHDQSHSGNASGCCGITSTTVQSLIAKTPVNLPHGGTIWSVPTVVGGQIYICVTAVSGVTGVGGYVHKIDLASLTVTHSFAIPNRTPPPYTPGGGGAPAVVGGQVFVTGIPGYVFCLNASDLSLVWQTDLRVASAASNQPVNNPLADTWSSPVVANGNVYVGCGEGESQAYGFIYCLNATNGNVVWLYSTDQFVTGTDNSPNVIPSGAVGLHPLPSAFTSHADPPHVGANVWSSCAYDPTLNRIYVGLGNSSTGGGPAGAVDFKYGSGVISLDAGSGAFKGYFQPSPSDSYYPTDEDIDICSSPLLFTQGGKRVVAIGSKSGAFMLLDANTMAPLQRRQMLPRDAVTGGPVTGVDTTGQGGGENLWGVFGTPSVHSGTGKLFVGVGGYSGIGVSNVTPFVRAVDWATLADAWPTTVQTIGANKVAKYTNTSPPMYTSDESGLCSPAVANDLVFVCTNKTALYAFDVNCGTCIWTAPGLPSGQFALGVVIYGNNVIVGAGSAVHVYSM